MGCEICKEIGYKSCRCDELMEKAHTASKSELNNLLANIKKKVFSLKKEHYVNDEDCWYSCPMSRACCNDAAGEKCNCGAQWQNGVLLDCIKLIEDLENKCI